jgi:hypothetical protein
MNTIDDDGNSILHSVERYDTLQCLLDNTIITESIYNKLITTDNQVETSSARGHLNTEIHVGTSSAGGHYNIQEQLGTSSTGGHLNTENNINTNSEESSINNSAMNVDGHQEPTIKNVPHHDYIDDESQQQTRNLTILNHKNRQGNTPLHIQVATIGGLPMIQILVDAKADIYATNEMGESCLHTCAQGHYNSRYLVIQKLVDIGVDVMLKDNLGKTALDYIPETDTRSREYLEDVIVSCSSNPRFKRANINTNSKANEDDKMDTYFDYENNEDDDQDNDN